MAATIYTEPPRVPLIDPQTGKPTREGYLFFTWLVKRGGDVLNGGVDNAIELAENAQAGAADLLLQPAPSAAVLDALLQPAPQVPLLEPILQQPPYTDLTTWPGSTSIRTVGVLTVGTWQASTIAPAYGGTGLTSYTIGDLLYASGAAALSRLAGVATGNALISGGVGAAPSWGKIGLTTHVSGVLPVANGGTGVTALSSLTANPSASIGLTAVNGSASTFMRSDAAPALSQSIAPTWTGNHIFSPASGDTVFGTGSIRVNNGGISVANNGVGHDPYGTVAVTQPTVASNYSYFGMTRAGSVVWGLGIDTSNRFIVGVPTSGFSGTIPTPALFLDTSGNFGVGIGASAKLHVNGTVRVDGQATTGANTATFTATNKPGSGTTAPSKWLPINLDGTTYYVPCWT